MCSLESSCVHGEKETLSVMRKPLHEDVFVLTLRRPTSFQPHVQLPKRMCEQFDAYLCRPHFLPEITSVFCIVIQKKKQISARAQATRGCAARVCIFGTSLKHE